MKVANSGIDGQELNLTSCERMLYILTEACIVICSIPVLMLFVLGVSNGLVQLIEEDDYLKWIVLEKVKKVSTGGDSDDVSDMLKTHLYVSGIFWFTLVVIYGQMLFGAIQMLYKYSGLVFTIVLVIILAFNSWTVSWVFDNDCEDTTYYSLAIASNFIIYGLVALMIIGILILFLIGLWSSSGSTQKISGENKIKSQQESQEDKPVNGSESEENRRKLDARRTREPLNEGKLSIFQRSCVLQF